MEERGDDERSPVGDGVVAEGREHGDAERDDRAHPVTRGEEFGETGPTSALDRCGGGIRGFALLGGGEFDIEVVVAAHHLDGAAQIALIGQPFG